MILLAQGEKVSMDIAEIDDRIGQTEVLLRASEARETPLTALAACLTLGSGLLGAALGDLFSVQAILPFIGGTAAGLTVGTSLVIKNASNSRLAETVLTELRDLRAKKAIEV